MKTYSEKLLDSRWQKKRMEILDRDGWKCRKCNDATKTLHVHHWAYSGDPWEANTSDLITLCADCHQTIEGVKSVINTTFSSKGVMGSLYRFVVTAQNRILFLDMGDRGKVYLDSKDGSELAIERLISALQSNLEERRRGK